MGYHGGIITLELFSTGFLSTDAEPAFREAAETFIQKALEMSVSNDGALLAGSRRGLNKTEGEYIKLALDLAARAMMSGNMDIIQNVQKALKGISPLVGDDVKAELTRLAEQDPNKAALLVGAAELRHVDSTKLLLGMEMGPETRELLKAYNESRQVIDV